MASEGDLLPCRTCPWIVSNDARMIPRFNMQKAVDLRKCVGDEPAVRTIMACHKSVEGHDYPCMGYMSQASRTNIIVPTLVKYGIVPDPDAVTDEVFSAGLNLHRTYEEVLRKLRRTWRNRRKK